MKQIESQAEALGILLPKAFLQLTYSVNLLPALKNEYRNIFTLCQGTSLRRIKFPVLYPDDEIFDRNTYTLYHHPSVAKFDDYLFRFACKLSPKDLKPFYWHSIFIDKNGQGQCVLGSKFDPGNTQFMAFEDPTIKEALCPLYRELGVTLHSYGQSGSNNSRAQEPGQRGPYATPEELRNSAFQFAGFNVEEFMMHTYYLQVIKDLLRTSPTEKLPRWLEHWLVGTYSEKGRATLAAGGYLGIL